MKVMKSTILSVFRFLKKCAFLNFHLSDADMQEEGKHSWGQWRSQTDSHRRQREEGCRYPQSYRLLEMLTWALADGYRNFCQKFHKLLIALNAHTLCKLDSFLVTIFIVVVAFSMLTWLLILYMEYTVLTMLNVKIELL